MHPQTQGCGHDHDQIGRRYCSGHHLVECGDNIQAVGGLVCFRDHWLAGQALP